MSYYKYAQEQYEQPKENLDELWKQRLIEWRKEGAIVKQENPTRVSKARSLGYKAKRGFNTIRVRVSKGNSRREKPAGGRRPKRYGRNRFHPKKSKKLIAEQRASKKYENLEVLNSYWVAEDGNHKWHEVIMVDPDEPTIQSDDDINWIADQRNRVERGKTPEAKKNRGLRNKGKGAEKVRPSQNANSNKGK
ncbi:MAG: 50S ribosomal protein L15e [Nanohaloarchaea archaeon QH_8_44_6]|nr:MAG: 50S ribosomal protein L15e [Nanohaloarchaea archaeon QH_8_44_6]